MAAETPEIQNKKYTFYYAFIHHYLSCNQNVSVPVSKSAEEIPEAWREEVIRRIDAGEKIRWPLNPPEEEILKMETNTPCPKCGNVGMKFIWPAL